MTIHHSDQVIILTKDLYISENRQMDKCSGTLNGLSAWFVSADNVTVFSHERVTLRRQNSVETHRGIFIISLRHGSFSVL